MHRLTILTFTFLLGRFGIPLAYASSEGHAAATEQTLKESVPGDNIIPIHKVIPNRRIECSKSHHTHNNKAEMKIPGCLILIFFLYRHNHSI